MSDPAERLRARLRGDLRAAMRSRDPSVATLRQLLAAVDDAQAVPMEAAHVRYRPRPFGDPGVEAPRAHLDEAGVAALLTREVEAREAAAAELDAHDRAEDAAALRRAAATVRRYLAG